MDERLRNLAEACVEQHKTQADPKEIRKHVRIHIQEAYDLGLADGGTKLSERPVRGEPPKPDTLANKAEPHPTHVEVPAIFKDAPHAKDAAAAKAKAKRDE